MILIREETWKIISEEKPQNPSADWIKCDEKEQSTISLSIEDKQTLHICKCTSTKEMQEELQKVHEGSNLSNKLHILRKLY